MNPETLSAKAGRTFAAPIWLGLLFVAASGTFNSASIWSLQNKVKALEGKLV